MHSKISDKNLPMLKRTDINNYRDLVGHETVDRILRKATVSVSGPTDAFLKTGLI